MQQMFVSLERRMHCGIEKCCRYNIGSTYTCLDGLVFDFTSFEGCELQLLNKEETLGDFLNAIEIVRFRGATSSSSDDYGIALIEGVVSRNDEVKRLEKIRKNAKVLVAMGSCACFDGVNRLKNESDLKSANKKVYGNNPKETINVRPIKGIVPVDIEIPGCPVSKAEVESLICHVVWGSPFQPPVLPGARDSGDAPPGYFISSL